MVGHRIPNADYRSPLSSRLKLASCLLLTAYLLTSCVTYYQANYEFNREFETGNLKGALQTIGKKTGNASGHNRFLFFVNKGLVFSMLGQYEESNKYFESAYLFWEDFKVDYFSEGAAYLTNPMVTVYRGEDHEHLMVLYYKAMNFLKMGKEEEALVECRRLGIRLQQLSDRYSENNKYKHDAFINNLMGIIYDSDKDYNNAFIAYRNALENYKTEFETMFNLSAPNQLKLDLLRTAWLSGFKDEFEKYKSEFGMPNFEYKANEGGELVFFWHNGLAPIKAEWGVNFFIDHGYRDRVIFYNRELGLTFEFPTSNYSEADRKGLAQLEVFRVAFPKYIERAPHFHSSTLQLGEATYPLELAEDINKIAFKVLEERMGLEFSKALIRVALKKAEEYSLKKADKGAGALLGLFNALTEKADTRNWQTLPHNISYARVPLPEGQSTVTFNLDGANEQHADRTFTYNVKKGQILFHTFSSLESGNPSY